MKAGFALLAALTLAAPAHAEVIDEIVAFVNGDVITKSEFEAEEQAMTAEVYRRYAGDELDAQVEQLEKGLLLQMIDRKILVSHAQMIYDLDRMGDGIYESFKKQQNIEDEEEWERMLARDGMTVEGLKARLLEMYAPEEVIRFEVTSRIAVGDREVATYYAAHPEEFLIPGQVTIREIVLLADDDTAKENRRAEAAALRQEAASTEDFAALATAKSEAGTRTSGGLLGPLKRGELSPQLEELAFELPVGQVADLLETPYGFHIVLVESRTDDRTAPLEEAQEQLKLSLEDRKYAEELSLFMRKAREDSEWCVKPKYRSRLSVESPECEEL